MSGVAVVTGGARGIGFAIGRRLRDEGWQGVAAHVVSPASGASAGSPSLEMDFCGRGQVDSTHRAVVDQYRPPVPTRRSSDLRCRRSWSNRSENQLIRKKVWNMERNKNLIHG